MPGPIDRTAVSPSGLDLLLTALDPDRDRAAEKLLLLRRKLLKFFAWNRVPIPDDLVDETVDRVARRLQEGDTVRHLEFGAYVHGFARIVLRESWSRPRLVRAPEAVFSGTPVAEQAVAERRSRCLDRCLARLPAESRWLLLAYYQAENGAAKIASHRKLAAELDVSAGNLRLKLHRLRVELEGCVRACIARDLETEASSVHVLSREPSKR
jgi:DNA-directed RNA polymerase specialized sigma24 family protein